MEVIVPFRPRTKADPVPPSPPMASSPRRVLDRYGQLAAELTPVAARVAAVPECSLEDEAMLDDLLVRQEELIREIAELPARTVDDLLAKLEALLAHSGVDPNDDDLDASSRLILSVIEGLLGLTYRRT